MKCLFGHQWTGSKCSKCGKTHKSNEEKEQTEFIKAHVKVLLSLWDFRKSFQNAMQSGLDITHLSDALKSQGLHSNPPDDGEFYKILCVVFDAYSQAGLDELFNLVRSKGDTELEKYLRECYENKRIHVSVWTPTNPQLSSNMPLSSLLRIFIFTSGDGSTVLSCPALSGTLADTAGAPIDEFLGKKPFDVIAKADIYQHLVQYRDIPTSAWTAMGSINPDAAHKAQMGLYRTCIRPFKSPTTGEFVVCVLIYDNVETNAST